MKFLRTVKMSNKIGGIRHEDTGSYLDIFSSNKKTEGNNKRRELFHRNNGNRIPNQVMEYKHSMRQMRYGRPT
jgi:hypothetical protein